DTGLLTPPFRKNPPRRKAGIEPARPPRRLRQAVGDLRGGPAAVHVGPETVRPAQGPVLAMLCDLFARLSRRHQSVTFSRPFMPHAAFVRGPRSFSMIGLVRAAAFCATLALGLNSALAADKT